MNVVILCGGKGVRAFPFTKYLPKPLLPLRGRPIITEVIKSFISQGFSEFLLAAGYGRSNLEDYFEGKKLGGTIRILDTGDDTDTGGRVRACAEYVDDTFMVTYGDGLCDVPLRRLVAFHHEHGGLATVTSVPMFTQYGVLDVADDGRILQLREKPHIPDHWINAGFMVFDKEVFKHWKGENLEREVLPHLIEQGLAYSYRHDGFFKSVDSYKDVVDFEELINGGGTPWAVKEDAV